MDEQKFSKRYYRRQYLLSKMKVPTQSEVRQQLGGPLSEVFFKSLPPPERVLMGIHKPLEGPKTELWISPSDQLIGKVLLRPPLTTKYIKALTHQGIIDIGSEIEKKRIQEAQSALELAVADNEELMKFLAARQLEEALIEAKSKQNLAEAELEKDCAQKIEAALAELEERLMKEMEEVVEEVHIRCAEDKQDMQQTLVKCQEEQENFQKKYEAKLQDTVKKMKIGFDEDLNKERSRCDRDMSIATHYRLETLRAQRHAMECTHVAELMCALCSERSRCADTVTGVKKMYDQQISLMQSKFANVDQTVKTVIKPNEHYEKRIRSLVQHFQKFINFALNAVPSQAEFLLSLEQLLVVQMSDALIQQTEEIKQEVEVPYVPETQHDDRKQFVKRIRSKRDKSSKPFLLYDDALPGGMYMRLLEDKKLDPPYIVVGGHKYAEPQYYEQVRQLTVGVEWENKNEATVEVAAANAKTVQSTVSAAVQTQDNWCSLEFLDTPDPEVNSSNVRFSLVPEAVFKEPEQQPTPYLMDDAEIPDEVLDRERVISTTDAEPIYQDQGSVSGSGPGPCPGPGSGSTDTDEDEDLPSVPYIDSDSDDDDDDDDVDDNDEEVCVHIPSAMPPEEPESEEETSDKGEGRPHEQDGGSRPPDWDPPHRLSNLSYTRNSIELLRPRSSQQQQIAEQTLRAPRKSRLLETKNSLEIFKARLSASHNIESDQRRSQDSKRSSTNEKPLVRDSLEVLAPKDVTKPSGVTVVRELSKLNLTHRQYVSETARDSLQTHHSKLLQSKASISKENMITDAEMIEVIPIGSFCKRKDLGFDKHQELYKEEGFVEQDRFQLGLCSTAAYMTLDSEICDKMEEDAVNDYEKCSEFEFKLLLSGLKKEDIKDIPHPETCDLEEIAAKKKTNALSAQESTGTFVLWNPYETDLADFYRSEYKKKRVGDLSPPETKPKSKHTKSKTHKYTKTQPVTVPNVCKYPHMFDLNKDAYERHFGRTSSVIDRNLQFYRKLLPNLSQEEKELETKDISVELQNKILDMSDDNIKRVVQDLANGSDSHLHQKVYDILTNDEYKKMKIRSLLNLVKKYPSLAELFGKKNKQN